MQSTLRINYILLLLVLIVQPIHSQINKNNSKIENPENITIYYVDVLAVNTKLICLNLEKNISSKLGIVSFKTVGFPSKYFILKSTKLISQLEIKTWIEENGCQLAYFCPQNELEKLFLNKKNFLKK